MNIQFCTELKITSGKFRDGTKHTSSSRNITRANSNQQKTSKTTSNKVKRFFHTQKQFWILMYISALIIVLVHRTCIYYIIYMHWLNSSFGVYSCITLVVHMSHMGTSTRPPGQLSVSQCRSAVTGSKIQVHIKIIFKTKTPRDPFRLLTFIKILY